LNEEETDCEIENEMRGLKIVDRDFERGGFRLIGAPSFSFDFEQREGGEAILNRAATRDIRK
jgi:glutathione peroxidase-family protein